MTIEELAAEHQKNLKRIGEIESSISEMGIGDLADAEDLVSERDTLRFQVVLLERDIRRESEALGAKEREKHLAEAEVLKTELEVLLKAGWGDLRRLGGLLKSAFSAYPEIKRKEGEFHAKSETYRQFCERHGIAPSRITFEGKDNITCFKGSVLPELTNNDWLEFVDKTYRYHLAMGDMTAEGKEIWRW